MSEEHEIVMSDQRRKQSQAAQRTKSQLDLFDARPAGRPETRQPAGVHAPRPPEANRPPAPVRQADPSVMPPPVDPRLLEFVGGTHRGRPPKLAPQEAPHDGEDRNLLDVRQAAQRLGLSKSTLDKMRCTGRGPRFIRATDHAIRYDPADLKAFADARRRRSTSELSRLLCE